MSTQDVQADLGAWGLTSGAPAANGAGYSVVTSPRPGPFPGPVPEEVLVHEWLDQVTMFQSDRGYAMPNRDAAQSYGYQPVDGSWMSFDGDAMRGRVWDGSRKLSARGLGRGGTLSLQGTGPIPGPDGGTC